MSRLFPSNNGREVHNKKEWSKGLLIIHMIDVRKKIKRASTRSGHIGKSAIVRFIIGNIDPRAL